LKFVHVELVLILVPDIVFTEGDTEDCNNFNTSVCLEKKPGGFTAANRAKDAVA